MFGFLKKIFLSGSNDKLTAIMEKNPMLVDVRTPEEFVSGHPKGSINIPLNTIPSQLKKFQGKTAIVVFCRSGNRSGQAKAILEANGFKNVINGGTWENVASYTD